eukprot:7384061-Prymnesium_polylepis.3
MHFAPAHFAPHSAPHFATREDASRRCSSPTMIFEKSFDLNNNVIRMGPLTLITVDSGYSAVTEDNGEQKILAGGSTYLLTHRNWKFQKYLPEKIQSSNLKRIEVQRSAPAAPTALRSSAHRALKPPTRSAVASRHCRSNTTRCSRLRPA